MRYLNKIYCEQLCKTVVIALLTLLNVLSYCNAAPKEAFADRYAAIVIDANSGQTLFQANANARRYPASLTKMMTLYLLFDAMKSGRVSPNTPIPVSVYASGRPPTKIGFRPGETIPAEAAAKALITKSANDVAVAISEYLAGSERNFSIKMNATARKLGMLNTHFNNASGLPDTNNYSTARDLAILSLALRSHFPQQYRLFKTVSFQFRGRLINGHNNLVKAMPGVDGIKTGFTNMSGSNLATSMKINGKSLVAVVLGGRSARLRDAHMAELLRRYLPEASRIKTKTMLVASAQVDLPSTTAIPVPIQKADLNGENAVLAFAGNNNQPKAAVQAVDSAIIPISIEKVIKTGGVDPMTTSSNKDSSTGNWIIQIGALPSANQADNLLARADKKARLALANAKKANETFEKNGRKYHRARFVGFANKKEAMLACAALKKANFNCFALLK